LLRIRRRLRQHFCQRPPDLFLGIDAPDFNLRLEMLLRRSGIPTAHLVSPSVWAWRRGRVRKIRRAVDLMLCLFPFETNIYRQHGVPVRYIGHPLADEISPDMDSDAVRRQLELAGEGRLLACSCKQLACCTMTGHSSVLLSPRRAKSAWGNSRACCRSIRTSL
jgi:lipid-A-disaccharide synthase